MREIIAELLHHIWPKELSTPVEKPLGQGWYTHFFSSSSSSLILASILAFACLAASSSPFSTSCSPVSWSTLAIRSFFTMFKAFLWDSERHRVCLVQKMLHECAARKSFYKCSATEEWEVQGATSNLNASIQYEVDTTVDTTTTVDTKKISSSKIQQF